MTGKKRPWLVVAAVAVAVVGVFWAFREPQTAPTTGNDQSNGVPQSTAQSPVSPEAWLQGIPAERKSNRIAWSPPVKTTSSKIEVAPLPPRNTPLVDILADLQERARKGDVLAACRLATDLERCRALSGARFLAKSAQDRLAKEPPDSERWRAASDSVKFWTDAINQSEPVCTGIESSDTKESWRYLLQAAQAGHLASMVLFASGTGLIVDRSSGGETLDGWIALRENGLAFLQTGIEAGYAPAFEAARFIYMRGDNWGIPVPRDPVRSVAYSLALARIGSPAEQRRSQSNADYVIQSANLSPLDVANAQAMADRYTIKLLERSSHGSVDFTRGTYGNIQLDSLCEIDK